MGLNDAAFCRLPPRNRGYRSIVCENGERKSRATWQVTGFGLVTGSTPRARGGDLLGRRRIPVIELQLPFLVDFSLRANCVGRFTFIMSTDCES